MLTTETSDQIKDEGAVDELHSVFKQDEAVLRELAHIKRFLERYTGDHQFRTQILSGLLPLSHAAKECGCELNVDSLRPVFHPSFAQFRKDASLSEWPLTFKWDAHMRAKHKLMHSLRRAGNTKGFSPEFDFWRQRNIERCQFELGPSGKGIVHPAIAFELSSGCSVGCWFCGISAQKFGGHFSLANGGRQEWRDVLMAAKSVLGDSMMSGFCYWATDPLDNPDYLGFLEEYDEIIGLVPQTTTAIPLRNIELTRSVLQMWEQKRGIINRFSVLSTNVLRRIHETFSPEELLGVEMVLQNKKASGMVKFSAGRASAKKAAGPEIIASTELDAKRDEESFADGTIACVTGYLVNIVEKTVRLVSPTMPSKAWPDGFIVYASGRYESPAELASVMKNMVKTHMQLSLKSDLPIRLSEGVQYSTEGETPAICSRWLKLENKDINAIEALARSEVTTPLEIVQRTSNPVKTVALIEQLWKSGLIEQEARISIS